MSAQRPDDTLAFELYRELHGRPWWRFWMTEREKREARAIHRSLKVWMAIEAEADR